MKTYHCKVNLVENSIKELGNLIEAIDEQFLEVTNSEYKEVDWRGQEGIGIDFDYRCSVFFSATKTKKEIYRLMNNIKANPIKFLN